LGVSFALLEFTPLKIRGQAQLLPKNFIIKKQKTGIIISLPVFTELNN